MLWLQLFELCLVTAAVLLGAGTAIYRATDHRRGCPFQDPAQCGSCGVARQTAPLPPVKSAEYITLDQRRCPNFATCQDPVWCQQCGSCDVARQAAARAPRSVESADLHEALARQWDQLGMPDLAATERDIAAKLRGAD